MGPWYSCRYAGGVRACRATWLEEGPEVQAYSVFEVLLVTLYPRALLVNEQDPGVALWDASQRFS